MTHSTLGCWIYWIFGCIETLLYDTQHPRMLDKLDSNSTTPASREWGVGGSLSCPLYYEPRGSSYSNSTTPASRQGGGWVGVYPVLYIMNHVIHHIPTPPRLLARRGGWKSILSFIFWTTWCIILKLKNILWTSWFVIIKLHHVFLSILHNPNHEYEQEVM